MSFSYDETTPVITAVTLNDVCRPVDHDEAGNESAYAVTRSYWPRNLLASVSDSFNSEDPELLHAIAYGYDGRGVRAIRTESPSNGPNTSARRYYVYTPELQLLSATRNDAPNIWEPEADPNPSFANNAHYEIIWFGNRPVAQFNPGSFTRFTFADHLGTPILQTDTAANIAWRVEYEPFGSIYEVRNGSRTEQPLRFPGQELATTWEGPEESFNVHRWYKSSWGRYTQADPIGLRGGGNLYAYVDGDPISDEDPLGLSAKKKNCTKYASNIMGALKHAKHHKETGQSSKDPCAMLEHWLNKYEAANCWKIFPKHGELANDYLKKFCGGGGNCYGQHEEDPWWQKLSKWINEKQKSMADDPLIPIVPGPAPVPVPVIP